MSRGVTDFKPGVTKPEGIPPRHRVSAQQEKLSLYDPPPTVAAPGISCCLPAVLHSASPAQALVPACRRGQEHVHLFREGGIFIITAAFELPQAPLQPYPKQHRDIFVLSTTHDM